MLNARFCRSIVASAVIAIGSVCFAAPDEITYQALLTNNAGEPATATDATVQLDLFSVATGGTSLKTVTEENLDLSATGGYVNIPIATDDVDASGDLFVQVTITDGVQAPEVLMPRQKLTSVPFALSANRLDGRTIMVRPGEDVAAAYAKAAALPKLYNDRRVVMLMPGNHVLDTTLVMNAQAVDLVGFGNKSAAITGSADPLIDATATGGTGATIRNLIIQATGPSNRTINIRDGRIQDVIMNPTGTGTVLTVNALGNCSIKDFEINGNVIVTSYGVGTSFTNGYITGQVNSTGASAAATNFLSFINVGGIGAISFAPSGAFGILVISNVPQIGAISYAANTVLQAGSAGFGTGTAPLAVPDPLPGSLVANSIGNFNGWTSIAASSTGNVAGEYYVYLRK